MNDAVLLGYGRVSWTTLTSALDDDVETAWADYRGFHIGRRPDQAPPYSHLWAWTPDWLLRARTDGERAIIGALRLGAQSPVLPEPMLSTPVRYELRVSRTWSSTERRVGPLPADVTDRPVEMYEIDGESPLTFIRMLTAQDRAAALAAHP